MDWILFIAMGLKNPFMVEIGEYNKIYSDSGQKYIQLFSL